jgi:xanthine/uracil permease
MSLKDIEIIGLICLFLISVFFYIVRKKLILYHVACALILGVFIFYAMRYIHPATFDQFLLITFGLVFFWFGLAIIRIMLTRSVSLNMLASFQKGSGAATAEEDVAGRLNDAQHYYLIRGSDKNYHLTWFGWIFASVTAFAYHIFRIEK